jgi:glycine/D-amino acid oxidase-like deaminating enzyme
MNAAARTGNLHFFSWTPVCGFPSRAQDGRWIVKTPRGNVAAGKVVLCTNAHTPHFFDKADPVHAQYVLLDVNEPS